MSSERFWMALDPGSKSGAIAVIDDDRRLVDLVKMPDTDYDIAEEIREWADRVQMCLIESVGAFPGQGVTSSFHFGENYGFLRGVLVGYRIPFEVIAPRRWQTLLGVPAIPKRERAATGKRGSLERKKSTRRWAQRLFPELADKISLQTADALLLAECARRIYSGLGVPRDDPTFAVANR